MKIIVNRDTCQSVATCISAGPDVYELDDQSKIVIKGVTPQKQNNVWTYEFFGDKNQAVEGARACPFQAITVIDDSGGQIFPEIATPPAQPSQSPTPDDSQQKPTTTSAQTPPTGQ